MEEQGELDGETLDGSVVIDIKTKRSKLLKM